MSASDLWERFGGGGRTGRGTFLAVVLLSCLPPLVLAAVSAGGLAAAVIGQGVDLDALADSLANGGSVDGLAASLTPAFAVSPLWAGACGILCWGAFGVAAARRARDIGDPPWTGALSAIPAIGSVVDYPLGVWLVVQTMAFAWAVRLSLTKGASSAGAEAGPAGADKSLWGKAGTAPGGPSPNGRFRPNGAPRT